MYLGSIVQHEEKKIRLQENQDRKFEAKEDFRFHCLALQKEGKPLPFGVKVVSLEPTDRSTLPPVVGDVDTFNGFGEPSELGKKAARTWAKVTGGKVNF